MGIKVKYTVPNVDVVKVFGVDDLLGNIGEHSEIVGIHEYNVELSHHEGHRPQFWVVFLHIFFSLYIVEHVQFVLS